MTDLALRLRGLRKAFGTTVAVDGLDLDVPRGAIYGVIGPSGAGKTTCIRMIMSILFPDAGELSVLGHASALQAKDRIGYLPEERGVYRRMRVRDFLSYLAQLKNVSEDAAAQRMSELLGRLGLAGVEAKRCEDLSKGMLQRVQFVGAIINRPELIILDEPFGGLDPVSVRLLKEVVMDEHRRGATILFSTHIMAHAEELCQHVVMIHRGRKVLDAPMSGLRRQYNRRLVRFEPLESGADLSRLRAVPGVQAVDEAGDACDIGLAEGVDPAEAIRGLAAAVAPARVELARVGLEDVFIRLVTDDTDSGDAQRALREHLAGMAPEGASV